MSMRVVLVPLFGTDTDAGAVEAACSVARRFDGRVLGLFVRIDPAEIVPYFGEGVSPGAVDQLIRAAGEEMDRRRDAARAQFDAACAAAGLARADQGGTTGAVAAQWLELTGHRDEVVAARGRLADLIVFDRAEAVPGTEQRAIVEAALMNSGRPLLLAPAGWSQGIGHKVAIAWNGRAEAARALAFAMPIVEAANQAVILTAKTGRTPLERGEELATYLRWHGVETERRQVTVEKQPVGEALLRAAKEAGADLLVMGGYGRSRFTELVFGGVTQHVLAHAELPVFLAH